MEKWQGVFRTFLKGGRKDGKGCVDRHKGIDHVRTFEEASKFECFGGVLKDGYVDISFDDADMSEAFLDMAEDKHWRCWGLINPDNGHLHTFWRDTAHKIAKDGKDLPLAVGLVSDIHSGETYIPLRVFGVDRFPPEYSLLEDEEVQEVPEELLPVSTKIKLWHSGDGDGRNSDLYSYILVLQSQLMLDPDRIRDMYRECINKHILAEPLADSELDMILRDESFEKDVHPAFWKGNTFQHNVFGNFLMEREHFIYLNGQVHFYKGNVYTNDKNDIERIMYDYIPNIKKAQKSETLDYLAGTAPKRVEASPELVAFRNGVYDLKHGILLPLTPDIIVTNLVPWDYVPGSYHKGMDDALDAWSCGDRQIRTLLEECMGYCFYRSCKFNKAFILKGKKANGKSTFLKVLEKLLGMNNISALDLKNVGERFNKAILYKKLANIGDDISDEFIPDTSLFKKITDGALIEAEYKQKDGFRFAPYAKLIFSANDIPRMKDKTGAVLRRLVIIPFNAHFEESEDADNNVLADLTSEAAMQYLVCLGLQGLARLEKDGGFIKSDLVEEELTRYGLENNPTKQFIEEKGIGEIVNQPTRDVFERYKIFCAENGYQAVSKIVFSKQINEELHTFIKNTNINVNGKRRTVRIFSNTK